MSRPSLEVNVHKAVREYLLVAQNTSPDEAPLSTLAVARRLNFDRKTLRKYGLDAEIATAAECQARNWGLSAQESGHRSMNDMLRDRDRDIEVLRRRCEALIAQICLAEGNAQRLGIDPAELWKALPMPDRRLPHTRGRPEH
jgi:hypothetical protein